MHRFALTLICSLVLATPGWAAHYEAMTAYDRGDYETAAEVRLLAEQSDADAQFVLGMMYAEGDGVLQDDEEAKKWLLLSAQGDANRQTMLGHLFHLGSLSVPQDQAAAEKMFRMAAEQGVADAQYYIGEMYKNGQGVPQNYILSHKWLSLAAAQGHSYAGRLQRIVAEKMDQIAEAERLANPSLIERIKRMLFGE